MRPAPPNGVAERGECSQNAGHGIDHWAYGTFSLTEEYGIGRKGYSEMLRLETVGTRTETVDHIQSLGVGLLRSPGPAEALARAVEAILAIEGVPAAGVLTSEGTAPVAEAAGLDPEEASRIESAMLQLASVWPASGPEAWVMVRSILGEGAEAIAVDGALVATLAPAPGAAETMSRVGALLEAALQRQQVAQDEAPPDPGIGLAWTAHELREPLIGIAAAIEAVMEESGERVRDLLQRSQREIERLGDLIDPLLRWAAEPGHIDRAEVDLVELVHEAVDSAAFRVGADRIMVSDSERVHAFVDPSQVRAAIANLVRNALAYSPPSSPVLVTTSRQGSFARIAVLDGGPGVAESDRDRLFEPFARGSVGMRTRRGSGLGLFIARSIVEAHGGTLAFEPWEGGAIFSVDLPVPTTIDLEGRPLSAS